MMKNKVLKKMIKQALAEKLGAKKDDVQLLNDIENEHTQGGAQENCPKLNKQACNPYGVCTINLTFRKKKRHRKL